MTIMKNRIYNLTIISILTLFVGSQLINVPFAQAESCGTPAEVEFTFREGDNRLAEDITWELYKQEKNVDGGPYLGRSVRSGRITKEGGVRFTFDPFSIPSVSGRGGTTAFALKVYDIQRNDGAHIFWDVIIPCKSRIKETFTLSTLSVVIRDSQGAPIPRHPFQVYTQTYDFQNKPIIDTTVSTGLNTGDSGQKTIHLAPGEYILKVPVPDNRGQYYEETNVVVRSEQRNYFDYRAGNVRVTIIDGMKEPLPNATVELFTQLYDVTGAPKLGIKKGSSRTNINGQATLFHPAGVYALKISGPQGSTYTYYNIEIIPESNTFIEKQISTIRVSTRDENGTLSRGIRVSLVEQLRNADGELVVGKTLQNAVSDEVGEVTFYVAPGTYALKTGVDTIYNISVADGQTTTVTYRKKKTIVSTNGGKEVVVKGIVYDAIPNGSLVKSPNNPAVYFIEKGKIRRIPDERTFLALNFTWDAIHVISHDDLVAYPEGLPMQQIVGMSLPEGTLAKSDQSRAVYLITGGKKRVFYDGYSFEILGYDWNKIINVTTFVLDTYPNGDVIKVPVSSQTQLIKSAENAVVYRIENGLKRPFASEEVFFAEGHDWDEVRIIPFEEVRSYPLGAAIR